jgi:hypothetical protein
MELMDKIMNELITIIIKHNSGENNCPGENNCLVLYNTKNDGRLTIVNCKY